MYGIWGSIVKVIISYLSNVNDELKSSLEQEGEGDYGNIEVMGGEVIWI